MEYSFQPYLDELDTNWYEDDDLLHRLLERYAESRSLSRWGEVVAGPLRRLAEESALPRNRPRLRPFDAYGRRVDEVVLPGSTREALGVVEGGEGLGAPHGDPFVFYAKAYLSWQNGEAGVACSMACTDGLVRVLEALGDRPEHARAVERVRSSSPERVWHGAQFVTEIQGGSDVPANRVRAVPDGDHFRLHGRKWFCSNVNADYFLVTARPESPGDAVDFGGPGDDADPESPQGAAGPGLFLLPAYRREADFERNGYTIDRLKEKLGTRELATAEVTFHGALATPVGPLDRGLPNLVRYVLVPSRFACVLSTAAFLRRAERVVRAYTEFRTAFGRRIARYPLVRETVREIGRERARALAVVFDLLATWEEVPAEEDRPEERSREALDFRILLSLAKTVLTRRTTELLHEAIMLLGGNGIEELFSPLPRLYRDSVIMETWEGPHNVLLTQALRDLSRFEVDAGEFVHRVAGAGSEDLGRELERILDRSDGGEPDPELTLPFADLARGLVQGYGDRILEEEVGRETGN